MLKHKPFSLTGAAALGVTLLLIPRPAAADDTAYTSTGWISGVPVPSIVFANGDGRYFFRGNAHTARVTSTDPRLTGQRTIFVNGAYQADGSALIYGTAYQEVGTFNSTNQFTPSGGVWEISYRGVMQTNYALQLTFEGCGMGGTIDGLRMAETLTREPASGPLDPAVPYLYTGTISTRLVDPGVVLDNFDTNPLSRWGVAGPGQEALIPANGQLTVRGYWPGVITTKIEQTYAWGYLSSPWSLVDQQTLEWRVDLVGMNEHADMAALVTGDASSLYLFYKWRDYVAIAKFASNHLALLTFESAAVKNNNAVLVLALTRVDPDVILTGRVLDKDNNDAVLYQVSVRDTPAVDPTISSAQISAISGMFLTVGADVSSSPRIAGNLVMLESWQYNNATRPAAEVTYDNLERRVLMETAETNPVVGIEQAVRLTWLGSYGVNYSPECAPAPQGPWSPLALPVSDGETPGLKQIAVPLKQAGQFYRLVQVP